MKNKKNLITAVFLLTLVICGGICVFSIFKHKTPNVVIQANQSQITAASGYGLKFGNSDAPIESIDSASTTDGDIISGIVLNFNIADDLIYNSNVVDTSSSISFPSKDYKATGYYNDLDIAAPNYSFATNFSGDKEILKESVCDMSTVQSFAGLIGYQPILIDCSETKNGYIAYITQESTQAPEISLYALAAVSTGSSEFPTAYVFAEFDDATLNTVEDNAPLFPDKPVLTQEMYIKNITSAYQDPNSSIAASKRSFLKFVESIRGIN